MADDNGVEIWLEVHGSGTSNPAHIRTIMEVCGHPKVGACWNSNLTEVKDGSIKEPFTLLSKWLLSCHINDLFNQYPWRELFNLMRLMQYDRFTLAEMGKADDSDPVGTLKKYRQKWVELTS
ncbi:hypothetical protein FJY63_14420 [Candidatus Sumerlaeota bacterium]|nr:hypothetical protein [Candidatus Sumerlaeota bacterium]